MRRADGIAFLFASLPSGGGGSWHFDYFGSVPSDVGGWLGCVVVLCMCSQNIIPTGPNVCHICSFSCVILICNLGIWQTQPISIEGTCDLKPRMFSWFFCEDDHSGVSIPTDEIDIQKNSVNEFIDHSCWFMFIHVHFCSFMISCFVSFVSFYLVDCFCAEDLVWLAGAVRISAFGKIFSHRRFVKLFRCLDVVPLGVFFSHLPQARSCPLGWSRIHQEGQKPESEPQIKTTNDFMIS